MTLLNCRLQVIVNRPFFIKLVDENGQEIETPELVDELNETDFRVEQLSKLTSRAENNGKAFESFLLTNEQGPQYL